MAVSILGACLISFGEGGLRGRAGGASGAARRPLDQRLLRAAEAVPKRYGSFGFTAYAVWAGTLFLLPFAFGLLEEALRAPPAPTLAALYLGVFATIAAYASIAYAFARLPASRAVTLES